MFAKPLRRGISAGITVGTLVFGLSRKARRSSRRLKARAGRALRSAGSFMDELSDMLG